MLRQIVNKSVGLTRCYLQQTTRVLSTEFDPYVDSHSDAETEPSRARERCINQVTLLGRLGDDPKVIEKENKRKFAIFPFAVNEDFKNPETGVWENRATWFKILATTPLTIRVAERLEKGDRVYVQGKILKLLHTDSAYSYHVTVLTDTLIRVGRSQRNLLRDQNEEEDFK